MSTLGWRGERRLGLQTIRLDTIVGTLDARRDFDRRFRPASNRLRSRWVRLALRSGAASRSRPSRCTGSAGCHFVEDGHHRVSIARAARQQTIDAYVTEVLTAAPAAAGAEDAIPGPARAKDAAPVVRSGSVGVCWLVILF